MKKYRVHFLILWLCLAAKVQAQDFSQLFIFGDSLSDVGNLFGATGGDYGALASPFYQGRFSNGPLYVEVLAAELGLGAIIPSKLGGNDYAWAGAFVGHDRSELGGLIKIPSIRSQVDEYLASAGGVADPQALYVFYPGPAELDSFLDQGLDATSGQVPVNRTVLAAKDALQILMAAGAVYIIVANMPDLNLVPQHAGKPGASELCIQYNDKWKAIIDSINNPHIVYFDLFSLFKHIRTDFKVVDIACFNQSRRTLCQDPENYLFFDGLHPTAVGHRVLGLALLAALKERFAVRVFKTWGALKGTYPSYVQNKEE